MLLSTAHVSDEDDSHDDMENQKTTAVTSRTNPDADDEYPRNMEIDAESASDPDGDCDHAWEEYNAADFGPDVVSVFKAGSSATAGPSTTSSSSTTTVTMETTVDPENDGPSDAETELDLERYPTPELRFSDEDNVCSKLISSQHSLSNLNLHSHEDPYSASADFGFDF